MHSDPTTLDQASFVARQQLVHPFCFACSGRNPLGFALRYTLAPDGSVSTSFLGNPTLESYPGVLHGGLVATLLDAVMTNCLLARSLAGMTAELTIRYHTPVAVAEPVALRAWRTGVRHGVHQLEATLTQSNQIKAHARAKFIVPR